MLVENSPVGLTLQLLLGTTPAAAAIAATTAGAVLLARYYYLLWQCIIMQHHKLLHITYTAFLHTTTKYLTVSNLLTQWHTMW